MKEFRFMKVSDTVLVDASNRAVAEKRARKALGDDATLISCPENSTVHEHVSEKAMAEAIVSSGAITQEQKAKVDALPRGV